MIGSDVIASNEFFVLKLTFGCCHVDVLPISVTKELFGMYDIIASEVYNLDRKTSAPDDHFIFRPYTHSLQLNLSTIMENPGKTGMKYYMLLP